MIRIGIVTCAFFATLGLMACSSDSPSGGGSSSGGSPSGGSSSGSSSGGSSGGSSSGSSSGGSSSLGSSCTALYGNKDGCCYKVAGTVQAAKDACDQALKVLEDGIAKGGKADTYESACKQSLDALKSAGSCK